MDVLAVVVAALAWKLKQASVYGMLIFQPKEKSKAGFHIILGKPINIPNFPPIYALCNYIQHRRVCQ